MIVSLHVCTPPPCTLRIRRLQHQDPPPTSCQLPSASLTKQGERFLFSLAVTRDPKTTSRLISKFVSSSTQHISLNTLSHLLSPHTTHPHLSSLALPLYSRISKESWFQWNPKLVAELVALLDKRGRHEEAEALIFETVSKLESRERELVLFYGNLMDAFCKHNSNRGFDDVFSRLSEFMSSSSSVYVKRQAYKSIVSGLCEMGRPEEAEKLMEEMTVQGLKPSSFEFRCVVFGYGRLGLFEEMERCVDKMESEEAVDTVCSNMILSCYGDHNEVSRMVLWLKKMKGSGIPFSIRTYNSVLNSCSSIMSLLQDMNSDGFPVSIEGLKESLSGDDELFVVEQLVEESSVLDEAMEWGSGEAKLDLHGMHLGSAYLVMLQWMEEMRCRFSDGKSLIPAEITVVCGSGKHSSVRGESPVKAMVKKMMIRTYSPLRIDRKNTGCFVAKGHVVRDWLS
ncbi:hypothetical protein Dsin_024470 [Dipteronia sinensis]|uniref:Smr domain-containing protein n=1 Tax=Dipteronia sinensis TaxID=43782 RepID=A0AAD9ZTU3_9ROSI|nr:hypothetical protein Dsin_024470 [Dipteronia sinensis]